MLFEENIDQYDIWGRKQGSVIQTFTQMSKSI